MYRAAASGPVSEASAAPSPSVAFVWRGPGGVSPQTHDRRGIAGLPRLLCWPRSVPTPMERGCASCGVLGSSTHPPLASPGVTGPAHVDECAVTGRGGGGRGGGGGCWPLQGGDDMSPMMNRVLWDLRGALPLCHRATRDCHKQLHPTAGRRRGRAPPPIPRHPRAKYMSPRHPSARDGVDTHPAAGDRAQDLLVGGRAL